MAQSRKSTIPGITSLVIGLCACDPAHNIGLTYYGLKELVKQKTSPWSSIKASSAVP
jgi:hypothetical protein